METIKKKIADKEKLDSKDYDYLIDVQQDETAYLDDRILAAKLLWEEAENKFNHIRLIKEKHHDMYLTLESRRVQERNSNRLEDAIREAAGDNEETLNRLISLLESKISKE